MPGWCTRPGPPAATGGYASRRHGGPRWGYRGARGQPRQSGGGRASPSPRSGHRHSDNHTSRRRVTAWRAGEWCGWRAGRSGGAARTFTVFGRHYALVVVDGLEPGTVTPYRVLVDGRESWPRPDPRYPPSVIRTRAEGQPTRLVFGSCRQATP